MTTYLKHLFFCFFLTFSVNGQDKAFIGYVDGKPMFNSFREKTLYLYNNDVLEVIKEYPKNYIVHHVKDNFICFVEKTSEGYYIVIYDGKEESRFLSKNRPSFLSLDDTGTLYFTDYSNLEINYIKKGKIEKTGLKGYVVSVVNNCLYYTNIHDPEITHANADLFEKDLSDTTKEPVKILSNISGESIRISTNGDFIYDEILKEGSFKPFLYDRAKDKLTIIETVDKKFLNATPFFSYQKQALVFYNSTTLDFLNVEF